MRTKLTTANLLEQQSARLKRYCSSYLSKKFCMPVDINSEAAYAVASATILGRGSKIWLDGEQVSLSRLKLAITVQYQNEPEKT